MIDLLRIERVSSLWINIIHIYTKQMQKIFQGYYYINNHVLLVMSINLLGILFRSEM